jgi:UDP-N-acetylmuramyl tripeptide synthase
MYLRVDQQSVRLAEVADVPVTLGGAARHNVSNALAAVAAASALDVPLAAIRGALARFGRDNADNAGRANLYGVGGATVLLDYAHNPHGMDALAAVATALPARRRILLIGQAGDRDDDAIRGLARSAWAMRPDWVIIKEMASYLRGRGPYDIPLLMLEEFRRLGMADARMEFAPSELAGAERALAIATAGDLVVLGVHAERARVLELLARHGALPSPSPARGLPPSLP